jgi:hypothetical protein
MKKALFLSSAIAVVLIRQQGYDLQPHAQTYSLQHVFPW